MSHHVYTTEAFVIDSMPVGEANRVYTLFTRDLGLIRAAAQGVRYEKSKLKHALLDYSHSRISLVRGKELWRITSAVLEENSFFIHQDNQPRVVFIAKLLVLIKRLVGSEEKNEELFDIVLNSFNFLKSIKSIKDSEKIGEEEKLFEYIAVLKVLNNLGYLKEVPELRQFILSPLSRDLVFAMKDVQKKAVSEINNSLRESQL